MISAFVMGTGMGLTMTLARQGIVQPDKLRLGMAWRQACLSASHHHTP
jgi:hypothetical protein